MGWLQWVFDFDVCNCYDNSIAYAKAFPGEPFDEAWAYADPPADSRLRWNGTYYDPYDKRCHNFRLVYQTKPTCNPSAFVPATDDYYVNAIFTVFKNPQIDDKYTMSFIEMIFGMVSIFLMGSTFGVIAGTFSTIFAGNQMASRSYTMRIKKVKEFCRKKHLPIATREKLEAHYQHLCKYYPPHAMPR